jgi:hypothetical protein
MMKPLSLMVAAVFAGAVLPAQAATAAEKKEMAEMKAQLRALQSEVEALKANAAKQAPAAVPAPVTPAPAAAAAEPASDEPSPEQRLTKMEMQVEQLAKDSNEGPIAGLSVGGYVDLGYFYNRNAKTNSFSFARKDAYGYENSSVGDIYLDIKKTFGSGATAPSAEIVLAPNRGYASGNNNIIHTAQVTIPVDATSSYFFGQMGSWAGYDYFQSNLSTAISHNLLYDFADPGFFVGAGMSKTIGNAAWKFMLGNPNARAHENVVHTPTFQYRLDYTWDSKTNIGWAGYFGQTGDNNRQDQPAGFRSTVAYTEADISYSLFETTINAQVDYGRQKNAAWNGGDSTWWGFALQGNYKFSDSFSGTLRADYLDNSKNGGGTPALYALANGTDTTNGFGIDPACFAAAQANDPSDFGFNCKGAKRSSLAAALLWYPSDVMVGQADPKAHQIIVKGEVRVDHADIPVFAKKDGSPSKSNTLVGLQAVYSF